jgi:hypothetical protein
MTKLVYLLVFTFIICIAYADHKYIDCTYVTYVNKGRYLLDGSNNTFTLATFYGGSCYELYLDLGYVCYSAEPKEQTSMITHGASITFENRMHPTITTKYFQGFYGTGDYFFSGGDYKEKTMVRDQIVSVKRINGCPHGEKLYVIVRDIKFFKLKCLTTLALEILFSIFLIFFGICVCFTIYKN